MTDADKLIEVVFGATRYMSVEIQANQEKFDMLLNAINNPDFLYIPSDKLMQRVLDYRDWCSKHAAKDPNIEDAGKLMEEVALLAFSSLRGYNTLLSYQSYADQYDLVISGTSGHWRAILHWLGLDNLPVIVVEAKNTDTKVDVPIFTRLCSIVQNTFDGECGLGVFFTRTGATGFPSEGRPVQSLRYAQARQVIFHAKTNKHLVVLTDMDIDLLLKPGGLLHVLRDKILQIKMLTGSDFRLTPTWHRVELPPHLKQHIP